MATSTNKVLCRYFMNGSCSKGSLCTFSHDHKDQPDMVCRYYIQGSCWYGDHCRYDHVRPKHKQLKNKTSGEPREREKTRPSLGPVLLPSLRVSGVSARPGRSAEQSNGDDKPTLVPLKKDPTKTPKRWIQAAEFVPGRMSHGVERVKEESRGSEEEQPLLSYSSAASSGLEPYFLDVITSEEAASLMCPFAEMGVCPFGESCEYQHGDVCDMCQRQCLSPFDPEQRKAHHRECVAGHEREMERAFAFQKSEGKVCGICMEVVHCKSSLSDRRFGILSNCEHCFCLSCIRKWRGSTHTGKKTIRACPLCRIVSFFVIPSEVWVEGEGEKQKLVEEYKGNLRTKHCRHFDKGKGACPFGNNCFYRHEYPDGTKATLSPRIAMDSQGEGKYLGNHTLWQFIEERDDRDVEVDWEGDWYQEQDSSSGWDTD